MRWYVGDIQGCAREFAELLRVIRFDPSVDELICLGDLLNRGPDSLETLRLWRDVGGRGVLGNHEVYALLAHAGVWPRKRDTLQALFDAPDGDALLARLRALPVLLHRPGRDGGPDVWAVHAGLDPRWRDLQAVATKLNEQVHDDAWLEHPDLSFATRVRCCTAIGELASYHGPPDGCPPPFHPWDTFYTGDAIIVHGHWAWRGHYRGARTIGLDSACVHDGPLSAWCQEEDRVVQVRARG